MKRTFDATFLNEVANDETVRPLLGEKGGLDFTVLLSNPDNYAIVCERGGFLGIRQTPGIYEIHTLFRPGDGKHALRLGRECQRWMFLNTDCVELRTKVPHVNRPATWLTSALGLSEKFSRNDAWEMPDSQKCGVSYFALGIDEWVLKNKVSEIKDAYIGVLFMMAKASNGIKGVALYNRMAAFAGYDPITIISSVPFIVNIHGAITQFIGGQMETL